MGFFYRLLHYLCNKTVSFFVERCHKQAYVIFLKLHLWFKYQYALYSVEFWSELTVWELINHRNVKLIMHTYHFRKFNFVYRVIKILKNILFYNTAITQISAFFNGSLVTNMIVFQPFSGASIMVELFSGEIARHQFYPYLLTRFFGRWIFRNNFKRIILKNHSLFHKRNKL